MDRSSGFGSTPSNYSLYSNSLSLRLPYSVKLATKRKSLTHYAKGTQSPDYTGSYCLYVCGFRFYFTPLPGFFSPFLHSTGSLSVSREYLALPDGPGRFTQNSSCSALLRILLCFDNIRIRNCHALWSFFPESSSLMSSCNGVVLQPHPCRNMDGLGCSPFARHYWGNHCLFSFPAGTKMFQFPALASNNVG